MPLRGSVMADGAAALLGLPRSLVTLVRDGKWAEKLGTPEPGRGSAHRAARTACFSPTKPWRTRHTASPALRVHPCGLRQRYARSLVAAGVRPTAAPDCPCHASRGSGENRDLPVEAGQPQRALDPAGMAHDQAYLAVVRGSSSPSDISRRSPGLSMHSTERRSRIEHPSTAWVADAPRGLPARASIRLECLGEGGSGDHVHGPVDPQQRLLTGNHAADQQRPGLGPVEWEMRAAVRSRRLRRAHGRDLRPRAHHRPPARRLCAGRAICLPCCMVVFLLLSVIYRGAWQMKEPPKGVALEARQRSQQPPATATAWKSKLATFRATPTRLADGLGPEERGPEPTHY